MSITELRDTAVKVAYKIKDKPGKYKPYDDYYRLCLAMMPENQKMGIAGLKWLAERLFTTIPEVVPNNLELSQQMMILHKAALLSAAPYDFDSYIQYAEWNRPPERRFYYPRRPILKQVVDALQDLADDKLDKLGISMPPGTGKSTLALFYLTWLAGKNPDMPILTGSHSNNFVRGAYDECLRIMDSTGEYLWHDVFPNAKITSTNAKDCRIDINERKRFETLQFTSIGSGNAGLFRARQLLFCDDLVSGIEVAMSKERLDKLWEVYNTDLRQRMIGTNPSCKELHIATRWSIHDVLGRLEIEYEGNPRVRFITLPALNDNDESNFDYPFGVGFSTEFYREQREIMEDASFRALFMNQPIEREGVLYAEHELRRYFELPDGEPDAIIAACDTKTKGDDYCVMPVAYQFGPDFYIDAVICDNGKPEAIEPRLASLLTDRQVHLARFESNQAGGKIAEKVQGMVKELGGRAKITTKYTTQNKETRIIVASPFVKDHFLFKDNSVIKRDREYRKFIQFLCGYTMSGRNRHDDVPDALAQLADYIQNFGANRVEIVRRPF